jgi:hypothetical protein
LQKIRDGSKVLFIRQCRLRVLLLHGLQRFDFRHFTCFPSISKMLNSTSVSPTARKTYRSWLSDSVHCTSLREDYNRWPIMDTSSAFVPWWGFRRKRSYKIASEKAIYESHARDDLTFQPDVHGHYIANWLFKVDVSRACQ